MRRIKNVMEPVPRLDPKGCQQTIWTYGPGWTREEQCRRTAQMEELGQMWCYQHAPSRVAALRETQDRRNQEKYERFGKPRAHAVAMFRIIKEIAAGRVNDPQGLCAGFLAEYEKHPH